MAAKSANTISDVCSHLASHGIVLTHPFAGFAAVAAGTVHSHIRYWPQSSSVHIDAAHYLAQDAEILNGLRQICASSSSSPSSPLGRALADVPLSLSLSLFADPIAARWYESLAGLQLLYFNLARGVLDSDPFKVRARVLQLLRSAKDDADVGSPVRGGADAAAGGAHGAASAGARKGANGAAAGKGGARKASKGERGRPGHLKRADSSSTSVSSVFPSVLQQPSAPSPGHNHGLPHSLSGIVSPLDTPLGADAGSTSTSDGGPFAPLYAGAPTPTSAMFPPGHPLTSLDSAHHASSAHQHHAHADSGPSPADLGLLPVPGDFSFDLSGAGGLGGLGGLGALSTLDEWGAGYYFGGSNWGLGGFGGLGVAPGAYGGPGPLHGAPYAGDLGWGGL